MGVSLVNRPKGPLVPGVVRKLPIEDLVRWAFRDELPKDRDCGATPGLGFGHAWGSVAAYGELLAKVDDCAMNRWGVVPFSAGDDAPHPDAEAIARAVADLDGLELDLPEGWDPLADLGPMDGHAPRVLAAALERLMVTEKDGSRRLKLSLRRLVFRQAILGGAPVWEAEVPAVRYVTGGNGQPRWFVTRRVMIGADAFGEPLYEDRELDGWSASGKRALPDAYRKTVLEPDPTDAAVARAEYEVWRSALDVLVEDLAGELVACVALPSRWPRRPWEEGGVPGRRVLADLTPAKVAPVVGRVRRRGKVVGAATG